MSKNYTEFDEFDQPAIIQAVEERAARFYQDKQKEKNTVELLQRNKNVDKVKN